MHIRTVGSLAGSQRPRDDRSVGAGILRGKGGASGLLEGELHGRAVGGEIGSGIGFLPVFFSRSKRVGSIRD